MAETGARLLKTDLDDHWDADTSGVSKPSMRVHPIGSGPTPSTTIFDIIDDGAPLQYPSTNRFCQVRYYDVKVHFFAKDSENDKYVKGILKAIRDSYVSNSGAFWKFVSEDQVPIAGGSSVASATVIYETNVHVQRVEWITAWS